MKLANDKIILSATDLSNHLSCAHLTQLNRGHALGKAKRPLRHSVFLERIIEMGHAHEAAYINHLKQVQQLSLVEFEFIESDLCNKTIKAMKDGIGVIAQGQLSNEEWSGRPDLLLRVERPSPAFGEWSYEVADTKLTKTTKAGTILQLSVYSDLLATVQGIAPKYMHVVMPQDDETTPFNNEPHRVDDYSAYYRLAKSGLLKDAQEDKTTYPEPVSHCDICQWWPDCDKKRRSDDHLTFVAGIQKAQIKELASQGTETLTALATSDTPLKAAPKNGTVDAYDRIHKQAKIQYKGIQTGEPEFEFLEVSYPNKKDGQRRGFLKLPAPDPADLFFDIESARNAPGGGLEYLLGFAHGDLNKPDFEYIWGMDHQAEKKAFQKFIDLSITRLEASPGMHIYHFAPYEPVALKRLATRHATREEELDILLRKQVFIDLYAVTRQSIRASVESYSIKCLEAFYGYEREELLDDARASMHHLESMLERGATGKVQEEDKQTVLKYNRDDCLSTLALRNWLESLRSQQVAIGIELPRPPAPEVHAPENPISDDVLPVFNKLTNGLEHSPQEQWNTDQRAKWLLAHCLEYFRREEKNGWWEYFRLRELDQTGLEKERNAITSLELQETMPAEGRSKLSTHRYKFNPQFVTISEGDALYEATSENGKPDEFKIGTVTNIDYNECIVDIKKTGDSADTHVASVFSHKVVKPIPMPATLLAFGKIVAENSPEQLLNAQYDLLCKRPPRFINSHSIESASQHQQPAPDKAYELIKNLDNSVLAIQGPPGTGKTYTGSHVIAKLAMEGKRIGITAVGHSVIANLLGEVRKASGNKATIAHRGDKKQATAPECQLLPSDKEKINQAIDDGWVVGATAWTWAHDKMAQQLDYLFIDEAGQMSLAMALAAARAAKNVVLLGDPQQLEQPQKASHPEGSEIAALAHLIGDQQTISEDQGIFLDTTYRMHPAICEFTSDQYYDSKLGSHEDLSRQVIKGTSTSPTKQLTYVPVEHIGNQSRCDEEAIEIQKLCKQILEQPHHWTDQNNEEHLLEAKDILVVAPYNAQVALLRRLLPENVRVGTVDKFQGQQAPIVIYSMTSSSVEDAPRGMQFLFSPNRFNVATSRARCAVFVFGSPTLIMSDCKTPEQIAWANGLCRFVEMAVDHRTML